MKVFLASHTGYNYFYDTERKGIGKQDDSTDLEMLSDVMVDNPSIAHEITTAISRSLIIGCTDVDIDVEEGFGIPCKVMRGRKLRGSLIFLGRYYIERPELPSYDKRRKRIMSRVYDPTVQKWCFVENEYVKFMIDRENVFFKATTEYLTMLQKAIGVYILMQDNDTYTQGKEMIIDIINFGIKCNIAERIEFVPTEENEL